MAEQDKDGDMRVRGWANTVIFKVIDNMLYQNSLSCV